MAKDPFLFPPPWSTYLAVSLKTLSIGTIPFEVPFVPLIYDYFDRILLTEIPIPPADFDIFADWVKVSYIPEIESSFITIRKQDDICGNGVPALKRVGVA